MKGRVILRYQGLVLILVSLLFTACPGDSGSGNSGSSDPLKKYAKAADDIAGTINAMIKAKRDLAAQGSISKEEELGLTNALIKANDAATVFHQRVRSLTAAPDAPTKAELTTLLSAVTSAVDDLNTQGVLGVKNPESQKKLAKFISTIKAAIAVFSSL